jgi:hypothetical protein
MPFALLFLLLASERLLLFDDVFTVPANDWRYVEVGLRQRAATVNCEFRVISGGSGVRVALVSHHELVRFRKGRSHDILATTNFERSGRLRFRVPEPGEYALVVDNRMEGRSEARVSMRVILDFAGRAPQPAATISPKRRLMVVLVSLALFGAIAYWAGRRIVAAFRNSASI